MLDAVIKRRSIRKYKEKEIPACMVEEVLRAGLLAPSSKNRQPWKFIVVTGRSKAEMLEVFRQGLEREKKSPMLPESAPYIGGAAIENMTLTAADLGVGSLSICDT